MPPAEFLRERVSNRQNILCIVATGNGGWSRAIINRICSPVYGKAESASGVRLSKRAQLPESHACILLASQVALTDGSLEALGEHPRESFTAYVYRTEEEAHYFFSNPERQENWACRGWEGDAQFTYVCFSNQTRRCLHAVLCNGSYLKLESDVLALQRVASRWEWFDRDGMNKIDKLWSKMEAGLIFANLVDFDMLYGHRRDTVGYARALTEFDEWLGGFINKIEPEDLVMITADHGNDPTFRGTDHTREQVPLFVLHNRQSRDLGTRSTFADVAASLADFFQLPQAWPTGCSFLATCTSRP